MGAEKRLYNWILVLLVLAIAVFVPFYKVQKGEAAVKQGIDLVGGVDLLLLAVPSQGQEAVTPDDMQGAMNIIRNRLDPEGVKEIVLHVELQEAEYLQVGYFSQRSSSLKLLLFR